MVKKMGVYMTSKYTGTVFFNDKPPFPQLLWFAPNNW